MDNCTGAAYLNAHILKVVTIERLPFSKFYGNGSAAGVIFDFLYALQPKYNFTMDINPPYDGNWGNVLPNGSWNGMVGMILRKEAEVGAAAFTVTQERAKVITFTTAYHEEPTGILIPPPSAGEKLSVLIRPFSPEVWAILLLTMGVLAPVLYILHMTTLFIRKDRKERKGILQMLGELFHFLLGSLVQESIVSPVNKTTRFPVALWWLSTLTVANIYVAFLVSYLAIPTLQNAVDSLDDLSKQHDLRWTYRKGTAIQNLFQSSSSTGVYKTIGAGTSQDDLVTSDSDGVNRVLSKKFAFIKEESFLDVALDQDFSETQNCRLTLTRHNFFTVNMALILHKKSVIIPLLNKEIQNALATGLINKWKLDNWPRKLWCRDAASYIKSVTKSQTRKLTLDDVQGAYFLFMCGTLSAIVGYLIERVTWVVQRAWRFWRNQVVVVTLLSHPGQQVTVDRLWFRD